MHDWFQWYVQQAEKQKSWAMYRERYLCPCCFLPTLTARAAFEACQVCDWEDDGQDSDDAEVVRGGPNGDYSLREARENYTRHLTMYRPADMHAFTYERMIRRGKEQLVRNLSMAVLSGADEHWEKALAAEQEFVAERARQDGLRH